MPHHSPLIATIVIGLVLAFALGALAQRLRISPIVGYLLAGIAVGPFTPGFVADQTLAPQLAEIGVILLMFGVGLHFSVADLLSVKLIAVPGALAQITVATLMGMGLAWLLGWSTGAGLVFGLALSVASTVVLLRALEERHLLQTERGRIAVGWLIVEDLATVLTLVLLPAAAGLLAETPGATQPLDLLISMAITLGQVVIFVAIMLIGGRRFVPWLLHWVAHSGSRELFRLAVLAVALGVAYAATELFGISFALGAFFAGMVMSESELSQQAANETLPLRDAFAVLFFIAVGMLLDPAALLRDIWPLLGVLLIVIFGKSIAALLIVLAFRRPLATALTIAVSLAQIGEFSFILAGLGVTLDLLPERARDLILAGAIFSILLNPFAFTALDRLKPWIEKLSPTAVPAAPVLAPSTQVGHTVLIGCGRVGSVIREELARRGQPHLVVEENDTVVEGLRAQNVECVSGSTVPGELLAAANIANAQLLFVAIPDGFEAGQYVSQARAANPNILIVARAHTDGEVEHLQKLGATTTIMGERQIARAMIEGAFLAPGGAS